MGGNVRPARLFRASSPQVTFREHFTSESAGLQFLSCGEYELAPDRATPEVRLAGEEALLFVWRGALTAWVKGRAYELEPYDVLYIPPGVSFRLRGAAAESSRVVQCSAPARGEHAPFHAVFRELSKREERIRRLKGKDVYLMFDVSESADKLVAGYTFFQPYQRSWPPHNHTDQEEVYFFIRGHGAMEVYASPETLSFVREVAEGDMVTIPFLNYHPVFSQESPLEFIWCIAGERYWVGDKNKAFMDGSAGAVTT